MVSQVIICALESVNYEGAVRNAISLNGNVDTSVMIAETSLRRCTVSPIRLIDSSIDKKRTTTYRGIESVRGAVKPIKTVITPTSSPRDIRQYI